jgi:hypothetical protein
MADIDRTQKLISPVKQSEAGAVVVDGRGRNVWQWKDEQLDSTSVVLKRLQNDALELEPTRNAKKIEESSGGSRSGRDAKRAKRAKGSEPGLSFTTEVGGKDDGGGFDPYNHR